MILSLSMPGHLNDMGEVRNKMRTLQKKKYRQKEGWEKIKKIFLSVRTKKNKVKLIVQTSLERQALTL